MADAETIRSRARDKYVGDLVHRQLAAADIILLSRTDIADAETCRDVHRWIETVIPAARLAASNEVDHRAMFATWTFASEPPLDGAALRAAIATLPGAVIRAKGIVRLVEDPGRRFVLQCAGGRWSLTPQGRQASALERTRSSIVCIGLTGQLDPMDLETRFAGVPSLVPSADVLDLLKPGVPHP
jgi:G3E family GTPase